MANLDPLSLRVDGQLVGVGRPSGVGGQTRGLRRTGLVGDHQLDPAVGAQSEERAVARVSDVDTTLAVDGDTAASPSMRSVALVPSGAKFPAAQNWSRPHRRSW